MNAIAIIAGAAVDVFATAVATVLLAVLAAPQGLSAEGLEQWVKHSPSFVAASLGVGLCCTVLGGYVAGRLAKQAALRHAFIVAFLLEGLGLATTFGSTSGDGLPGWYHTIALVGTVPACLLGGAIAARRQNEEDAAD